MTVAALQRCFSCFCYFPSAPSCLCDPLELNENNKKPSHQSPCIANRSQKMTFATCLISKAFVILVGRPPLQPWQIVAEMTHHWALRQCWCAHPWMQQPGGLFWYLDSQFHQSPCLICEDTPENREITILKVNIIKENAATWQYNSLPVRWKDFFTICGFYPTMSNI